ncbi:MAG: hypothetical protein E5V86_01395 [Mesorhizobium sp.]|nr:MAG: hypothetical protein E5W03_01670 [Mesorhizobium sp.]TIV25259.1 MAG: hypothetical protein E5W02_00040 [Mesorhizobium sp.]TIV68309.1 MAG: hypothetical protein E5V86_01395 [Mesorhizobium sp.]
MVRQPAARAAVGRCLGFLGCPVILLAVVIGRTTTVPGDLLFFVGGLIAGRFYRVGVPAPPGGNNNA